MIVLYYIFAAGLAVSFIAFTQRLIYWACKCREGKALLKDMRPSNSRYKMILWLYKHAKIEAVCWVIISAISLFAFVDCIAQIFKG
jgi:hypothetical protein